MLSTFTDVIAVVRPRVGEYTTGTQFVMTVCVAAWKVFSMLATDEAMSETWVAVQFRSVASAPIPVTGQYILPRNELPELPVSSEQQTARSAAVPRLALPAGVPATAEDPLAWDVMLPPA